MSERHFSALEKIGEARISIGRAEELLARHSWPDDKSPIADLRVAIVDIDKRRHSN